MHSFQITTTWSGETRDYRSYSRNHELFRDGKAAPIPGSSDTKFRGDGSRYNPEELLVGALSSCHMLFFLHLCADAGITVTNYVDDAVGDMEMNADGSGQFVEVILRPRVTTAAPADLEPYHHRAHEFCFISRSVNFPVRVEAS